MKTVTTREEFLIALDSYLPRNCSGAEIGTLHGDFSEMILRIINPETLVLIDPYSISESKYDETLNNLPTAYSTEADYQNILLRFKNEIAGEQVLINREFSYNAVKDFPNKGLDFVYIDASHVYEDIKRDLNDWLPKIKERGIISGHDYTDNKAFGVTQAVDEFCKEQGFEMIIFNENGGDWALKIIHKI